MNTRNHMMLKEKNIHKGCSGSHSSFHAFGFKYMTVSALEDQTRIFGSKVEMLGLAFSLTNKISGVEVLVSTPCPTSRGGIRVILLPHPEIKSIGTLIDIHGHLLILINIADSLRDLTIGRERTDRLEPMYCIYTVRRISIVDTTTYRLGMATEW